MTNSQFRSNQIDKAMKAIRQTINTKLDGYLTGTMFSNNLKPTDEKVIRYRLWNKNY